MHPKRQQLFDTYKYADREDKFIKYKDILIQDNQNNHYLLYSNDLHIFYASQSSRLIILKSKVLFKQNGFFDPEAIRWEGSMAEQRVADMLPYEFVPENK